MHTYAQTDNQNDLTCIQAAALATQALLAQHGTTQWEADGIAQQSTVELERLLQGGMMAG